MALQSHPDKNKHPQASAGFRIIKQAKEGLEDVFRYNDSMMSTQ